MLQRNSSNPRESRDDIPGVGTPGYWLKPEAGMVMAERAGKLLVAIGPKRTKLALELIDMATRLETKHSFYWDRAHGVIFQTLLYLDEQYTDLGFGAWMPFRFPDQWLSFCGVLTRVLAANGLIHSKNAETYRKLLDDTPPVEAAETIGERVQKAKAPLNPSQCHSNRGASTLDDLKERLQRETWTPADEKASEPFQLIQKGVRRVNPPP
jgi:hypothetical protein